MPEQDQQPPDSQPASSAEALPRLNVTKRDLVVAAVAFLPAVAIGIGVEALILGRFDASYDGPARWIGRMVFWGLVVFAIALWSRRRPFRAAVGMAALLGLLLMLADRAFLWLLDAAQSLFN